MKPVITLLTDFGLKDHYTGAMKGAILRVYPDVTLVDISHMVTPGAIAEAAFLLKCFYGHFPAGTIHLAVVDPGVGSDRHLIAVKSRDYWFVGPDNGVLAWAVGLEGAFSIYHLDPQRVAYAQISNVFHGRDILGPAAARLAAGQAVESFAAPADKLVLLPESTPQRVNGYLLGNIVHVDHFGNCITNIMQKDLAGLDIHTVEVAGYRIDCYVSCYADAAKDRPVVLVGSSGHLEIAIRQDSAARALNLYVGAGVQVCLK